MQIARIETIQVYRLPGPFADGSKRQLAQPSDFFQDGRNRVSRSHIDFEISRLEQSLLPRQRGDLRNQDVPVDGGHYSMRSTLPESVQERKRSPRLEFAPAGEQVRSPAKIFGSLFRRRNLQQLLVRDRAADPQLDQPVPLVQQLASQECRANPRVKHSEDLEQKTIRSPNVNRHRGNRHALARHRLDEACDRRCATLESATIPSRGWKWETSPAGKTTRQPPPWRNSIARRKPAALLLRGPTQHIHRNHQIRISGILPST